MQSFYEDEPEASLVQATAAAAAATFKEEEREEEHGGKVFPMEELTTITKDKTGGQLSKTLIHLVMADMAYVEKGQALPGVALRLASCSTDIHACTECTLVLLN